MELLVVISTQNGELTSPLFTPCKSANLNISTRDSIQDLRNSGNICGLNDPICRWLSNIRLHGTGIEEEKFMMWLEDLACMIGVANTTGDCYRVGDDIVEMTAVFTDLPLSTGGQVFSLEGLIKHTDNVTIHEAWD